MAYNALKGVFQSIPKKIPLHLIGEWMVRQRLSEWEKPGRGMKEDEGSKRIFFSPFGSK
jgi:hypothetical protein